MNTIEFIKRTGIKHKQDITTFTDKGVIKHVKEGRFRVYDEFDVEAVLKHRELYATNNEPTQTLKGFQTTNEELKRLAEITSKELAENQQKAKQNFLKLLPAVRKELKPNSDLIADLINRVTQLEESNSMLLQTLENLKSSNQISESPSKTEVTTEESFPWDDGSSLPDEPNEEEYNDGEDDQDRVITEIERNARNLDYTLNKLGYPEEFHLLNDDYTDYVYKIKHKYGFTAEKWNTIPTYSEYLKTQEPPTPIEQPEPPKEPEETYKKPTSEEAKAELSAIGETFMSNYPHITGTAKTRHITEKKEANASYYKLSIVDRYNTMRESFLSKGYPDLEDYRGNRTIFDFYKVVTGKYKLISGVIKTSPCENPDTVWEEFKEGYTPPQPKEQPKTPNQLKAEELSTKLQQLGYPGAVITERTKQNDYQVFLDTCKERGVGYDQLNTLKPFVTPEQITDPEEADTLRFEIDVLNNDWQGYYRLPTETPTEYKARLKASGSLSYDNWKETGNVEAPVKPY